MSEKKEDIWRPLAEGRTPQIYEPGRLIYLQDTQAEQFYYILSGTVTCCLSSGAGSERTLTLHHSGELIGEAAFFDGQPRVSSAITVTRCELVSVDRPRLSEVFARHPDLAISMLEYLSRTIRLLSVHVDGTLLQADQRIARYLLSLTPEADGTIRCTHEEIGAAVGVSRVTVSRVIGTLVKSGAVSTGYRILKITDKASLQHMAESDRR